MVDRSVVVELAHARGPVAGAVIGREADQVRVDEEEVRVRSGGRTAAHRARFIESARGVVAGALTQLFVLAVGEVARRVAAAAIERTAEREVDIVGAAVDARVARRVVEAALIQQALNVVVGVVVLEAGSAHRQADAFEVAIHDEVHDAGHGVRTVHRRRTAGQHLDALNERGGDLVQVGRFRADAARLQATAVDQHQRPGRAQAAQVDGGEAGGRVHRVGVEARRDLRKRVQQVFHTGRTREVEFFGVNRRHGAGRDQVRVQDTGAGHQDGVVRRPFLLSEGGRGDRHPADKGARHEARLKHSTFHRLSPRFRDLRRPLQQFTGDAPTQAGPAMRTR